jgi:ABC-type transporter MlaC component
MDNNPVSKSLYSLGYVSTNILQERVNLRYAIYGLVWTCQITTLVMEQRRRRWVPFKALTHRKWKNKLTDHEQHLLSIKPSQDSSWDDEKQDATHLVLAKICLLSSFSRRPTRTSTSRTIMKRATTSWKVSSYQQTSEINGGLSNGVLKRYDHGHETISQSRWRWGFYASTNEVLSLTIKTAGISLINKEAQLFATLLDNQGGTWVCISNEPQLINQGSTKIKRGWQKKSMQLSVSSSTELEGAKKS